MSAFTPEQNDASTAVIAAVMQMNDAIKTANARGLCVDLECSGRTMLGYRIPDIQRDRMMLSVHINPRP